jgi:hypothetical protein
LFAAENLTTSQNLAFGIPFSEIRLMQLDILTGVWD